MAALGVAASFVPFIAVYFIIRELVMSLAHDTSLNSGYITSLGWLAGGIAIAVIFLNFTALMCSHLAAFKTLYILKLNFSRNAASLPMGFHIRNSTGKLCKIVDENIEKLEGFIAHQLPAIARAMAAPLIMLLILLCFDWRPGVACLVPIVILAALQWSLMSGEKLRKFMKIYQDSLEDMNNASVEYVRDIAVVKAFSQTIHSFRKFYGMIRKYGEFALAYTKSFKPGYVAFIVLLHNIYLFLLPAVIWLFPRESDSTAFALVGPSGSGKSTLLRLIARFWDVADGTICIGGKDVRTMDPESLMSCMSFVFQDVVLFDDSMINNIRVGKSGASDEEVYAAARLARCDEFIHKMPEGYQSLIGENGCTLSGRERQRISIARALLINAPTVLLDEATASFDPENETLIQAALSELVKGRTVVVVAHRLRTIMNAGQILVLNSGILAEKGKAEKLLARKGLFARLHQIQLDSLNQSL